MNCIVKTEKSWAQQTETRNNIHYCLGTCLAGIGTVCMILGIIYVASHIINPVTISMIGDSWIRTMTCVRYDVTWIGLVLFCLGTLFKWRAEGSQASLEKTNRSIPCNELRQLQTARRVR